MATLMENYALRYGDSTIKNKITVAIATKALAVFSEDPVTTNHDNRLLWAREVLIGDGATVMANDFLWAAILAGSITEASTDAQILTAVGSLIDYFAIGV